VRTTYGAHSFSSFTVFPSCTVVGSFCLIYCLEEHFLGFCVVSLLTEMICVHFSSQFIDLNICHFLFSTAISMTV
jgi:hypothetical protein